MSFKFNDGISVLIPSYNERALLHNAIRSVADQDYRPIQLIIADNCSDIELLSPEEIKNLINDNIDVLYYRNKINLGAYRNYRNALGKVNRKYFVFLPSDDYYTDFTFFRTAIESMENSRDQVNCYVANSLDEQKNSLMMSELDFGVRNFTPNQFISGLFSKFHTNHAAIILNYEKLTLLDYQIKFLTDSEIDYYGFSGDEGFMFLFLISSVSSFTINSKPVVVRGYNRSSWSRSDYWERNKNTCMFLTYYKFLSGTLQISTMVRKTIYIWMICKFPVRRFNLELFNKLSGSRFKTLYLLSFVYGQLQGYKARIAHLLE
jgi:glycosyltransferase involved in cell wall biosynthesis